uniref:Uncharacterized protein n=1 Tax=Oryza barthii TaxID=65489 RepID=A0A0D3HBA2_9ORYZ
MASSLTLSPAMLCPIHQERLTNKEVDEMIHETGGGRWINYKEFKWCALLKEEDWELLGRCFV